MSLERLQSKICICKQKSDYNFALNIWRLTKNYSKAWSHILVFQYKKNKKRKAAGFLKHRKNTLYLGKARTLTSKVQKCVQRCSDGVSTSGSPGPQPLSSSLTAISLLPSAPLLPGDSFNPDFTEGTPRQQKWMEPSQLQATKALKYGDKIPRLCWFIMKLCSCKYCQIK